MPDNFEVSIQREPTHAILRTEGYINNTGGEKIAQECYKMLDDGIRTFILNLAKSPIVNSVGIAVLIELIERVKEDGDKVIFLQLHACYRQDIQDHGAHPVCRVI